jgi:5-methylcytosine-specific restriction endonuclease McrA
MSQGKQAQFYKTAAWVNCREGYLKSVGGLCEKCKAKGIITPATMVHHKIHINAENVDDPSITLSWSNLQALCRLCHAEEHGEIKRYEVGENGEIRAVG